MADLRIPSAGRSVNMGVGGPRVHQPIDPNSGARPGQAKLAAGIEKLAAGMKKREEEQNARLDGMRSVQATGAAEARAAERIAELDVTSPTYEEDAHAAYMEEAAAAGEDVTFSTGEARDLYNINATKSALRVRSAAFERKTAAAIDLAMVERDELESSFKNRVRANPDQADAIMSEFESKAAQVDGIIPKHIVAKRNAALMDDIVLSRAEGLAEKGRYDEATSSLDEAEAAGVDPSHIRAMKRRIKQIESQDRLDHLRGTMGQAAQLQHLVATGQAGPREIDAARDAGLFRGREGSEWALRTMAANVAKAGAQKGRALEESLEAVAGGWHGQSDVDRLAEAEIEARENNGEEMGAAERLDLSLDIARATGYVPSSSQRILANLGRTENPQNLALSAKYHNDLSAINPTANTGAPERAQVVASLVAHGEDPLKAAELVLQGEKAPPPTKEQRDAWNETASETDWGEIIEEENPALDADAVNANPKLLRDAREIANRYVPYIGADQAMAVGARIASRRYLPTNLYGQEGVQEYAPDALLKNQTPPHLYGPLAFPRFIQDDLRAGLEASGITPGVSGPDENPWGVSKNGVPPVWPVVDADTRKDIAAGRQPSYRIATRDENGLPTFIYNAETGRYARYILPTKEEFSKAMNEPAVRAEKKAAVDKKQAATASKRKKTQANKAAISKRSKQIGEEMDKLPANSGKF